MSDSEGFVFPISSSIKKCGAVILDPDNRLLIVEGRAMHFNNHETVLARKWGLPKGHREDGEPEIDCAIREVKEETGLDITISSSTYRMKVADTLLYFIRVDSPHIMGTTSDTSEIKSVKWVNPREIFNLNCNRGLKSLMMNYQSIMKRAGLV